ncbi:MAG TPA: tRNA preQ1(34) S-adenosylmethionine ribosyltransferase-isomerase QueA [Gemmatimonadaceae bacterium]|nr:tRNA preQ1(34) S-adenosylmethionine ribosyltransferase-isomerase QueA [Gemmatimonadaceae bacterium]
MRNGGRTADYEYELPPDRIAQVPLPHRDESRLMIVHRETGVIEHSRFRDLPGLFAAGDAMVLNTTKVLRARLLGLRASGAPAEILLLHPVAGEDVWEAMVSPGGKLRPGRAVHIAEGFDAEILEMTERRTRLVRLISDQPVHEAIARHGHIPLPPYIDRVDEASDATRYQTVFAREEGSVAAPTAGLHFTDALLAAIRDRGVDRVDVLLHVGAGTFKPVETDDPAAHVMHEEWFRVSGQAADTLNDIRANGGRVWAVGTTSARTLESVADESGRLTARDGETRLFIRPGYRFRAVDKLITNFHLPRSTLLMLVAAFAGYGLTMHAYRTAVTEGYRFYSYGDAMAIV